VRRDKAGGRREKGERRREKEKGGRREKEKGGRREKGKGRRREDIYWTLIQSCIR
jgi:hypothetical protein